MADTNTGSEHPIRRVTTSWVALSVPFVISEPSETLKTVRRFFSVECFRWRVITYLSPSSSMTVETRQFLPAVLLTTASPDSPLAVSPYRHQHRASGKDDLPEPLEF